MAERKFNDVEVVCAACGARLLIRRGRPGLLYKCPKCTEVINFDASSTRPAAESVEGTPMVKMKDPGPLGPEDEYGVASGVDQPPEKTYFPVVCPTCKTKMYAAREQVGKSLTCPDCHRSVIVPPPPMPEPKPPPIITALLDDHYKVLPGVDQPPPGSAAYDRQFSITCPLCHTRVSATEKQIGQSVTCPDCRRPFKVKAPEPAKPKRQWIEDDGIEIPIAPTFERPVIVVPTHESTHRPKVKRTESEAPPLPALPLVNGVFNFLLYRSVWPYLLGYGSWLGVLLVLFGVVVWAVQAGSFVMMGAVYVLIACSIFLGLWFFAITSLLLAILQDTSEGLDRVENWPESLLIASEISHPFYILIPFAFSIGVGGVLMSLLRVASTDAWFLGPIGTVVAFPLFLLSMMANESPLAPYSYSVWSGVLRSLRWWTVFYLESTVLLGGTGYLSFLAWSEGKAVWVFCAGFVIVGALLLYFRLLGRLAWITALQPDDDDEAEDDDESHDGDFSRRPLVGRV